MKSIKDTFKTAFLNEMIKDLEKKISEHSESDYDHATIKGLVEAYKEIQAVLVQANSELK